MKNPFKKQQKRSDQEIFELERLANDILGRPGQILSFRKEAPEGEEVYWNACVWDDDGNQLWYGDFNITRDSELLVLLANAAGPVHLTPEQPFRFVGLEEGRKDAYDASRIRTFQPNLDGLVQPTTRIRPVPGSILAMMPVLAILAVFLGGCASDNASSESNAQDGIELACDGRIQALTDVGNGHHGTTSGFIIVCEDGTVEFIDD